MKMYQITLGAEFYAADIEHAWQLLAEHFTKLATGQIPPDLFVPGYDFTLTSSDKAED